MSAPEVGDRVRVIAGQWTGWEGVVMDTLAAGQLWIGLRAYGTNTWTRCIPTGSVEKVPTTPTDGHRGDETGADVETDPDDVCGAQNGGRR